jgi:RNA polymerase sigma-70 factor (ECF subfamily)
VPDGDVHAFKESLTEEIADFYFAEQRAENAYIRRVYWHEAHYSLDCGDGIENDAIDKTLDPVFEILADKLTKEQLYAAIDSLPEKQGKRIYAHFILGISQRAIAKKEKVSAMTVNESISGGLRNLEKYLKKIF